MSNKEPKVTKCWAKASDGRPSLVGIDSSDVITHRPAILMWKEDYERLLEGYRMLFDVMDDEYSMTDGDVLAEIDRQLEAKRNEKPV